MKYFISFRHLPFELENNQVVYVENVYDGDVNDYILQNYDAICRKFADEGFEFVYLPKMVEKISHNPEFKYVVPGTNLKEADLWSWNGMLLDYMMYPEDRVGVGPSLLYRGTQGGVTGPITADVYTSIALNNKTGYKSTHDLSNILKVIAEDAGFAEHAGDVRKMVADGEMMYSRKGVQKVEGDEEPDWNKLYYLTDEERETRKLMWKLRHVASQLRLKGVGEHVLRKLIKK